MPAIYRANHTDQMWCTNQEETALDRKAITGMAGRVWAEGKEWGQRGYKRLAHLELVRDQILQGTCH